jgi:hypothetical protein
MLNSYKWSYEYEMQDIPTMFAMHTIRSYRSQYNQYLKKFILIIVIKKLIERRGKITY